MNSVNPSTGCNRPSVRSLPVLILTTVLSLTGLSGCATQRMATRERSNYLRQHRLSGTDTASLTHRTVVYDTVHVVTNETVWLPPDSLGRQYPLKTIRTESGGGRMSDSEVVYQKRDSVNRQSSTIHRQSSDSDIRAPTNQWVPWVVMAGLILIIIVVIAIKIFLIRL